MKALSLTQPWADVILEQGKRVENRTAWTACNYRGPILLHDVGTCVRTAFTDQSVPAVDGTLRPDCAFDTPGLLGVGDSPPYFHDGRYKSLRELKIRLLLQGKCFPVFHRHRTITGQHHTHLGRSGLTDVGPLERGEHDQRLRALRPERPPPGLLRLDHERA